MIPKSRHRLLSFRRIIQVIIELPFYGIMMILPMIQQSTIIQQYFDICIKCIIYMIQQIVQDPIIHECMANMIASGMNVFIHQPNLDQLVLHMATSLSKTQPDIARQQGQDFPMIVSSFVQGMIHAVNPHHNHNNKLSNTATNNKASTTTTTTMEGNDTQQQQHHPISQSHLLVRSSPSKKYSSRQDMDPNQEVENIIVVHDDNDHDKNIKTQCADSKHMKHDEHLQQQQQENVLVDTITTTTSSSSSSSSSSSNIDYSTVHTISINDSTQQHQSNDISISEDTDRIPLVSSIEDKS